MLRKFTHTSFVDTRHKKPSLGVRHLLDQPVVDERNSVTRITLAYTSSEAVLRRRQLFKDSSSGPVDDKVKK